MNRIYSLLTVFDNKNKLIAYSICGSEHEYEITDNEGYTIKNWIFDSYENFYNIANICKNSVGVQELINL